jgi:hypothetical protein
MASWSSSRRACGVRAHGILGSDHHRRQITAVAVSMIRSCTHLLARPGLTLPEKRIFKVNKFETAFLEARRRSLNGYIQALLKIPPLARSLPMRTFVDPVTKPRRLTEYSTVPVVLPAATQSSPAARSATAGAAPGDESGQGLMTQIGAVFSRMMDAWTTEGASATQGHAASSAQAVPPRLYVIGSSQRSGVSRSAPTSPVSSDDEDESGDEDSSSQRRGGASTGEDGSSSRRHRRRYHSLSNMSQLNPVSHRRVTELRSQYDYEQARPLLGTPNRPSELGKLRVPRPARLPSRLTTMSSRSTPPRAAPVQPAVTQQTSPEQQASLAATQLSQSLPDQHASAPAVPSQQPQQQQQQQHPQQKPPEEVSKEALVPERTTEAVSSPEKQQHESTPGPQSNMVRSWSDVKLSSNTTIAGIPDSSAAEEGERRPRSTSDSGASNRAQPPPVEYLESTRLYLRDYQRLRFGHRSR